jgi:hypothetical protein
MTRTAPIILVTLTLLQSCGRDQQAKTLAIQGVDLTGEWAVEWQDSKSGYKETVYVWVMQNEDKLTGSAMDPNLIPAAISGVAHLGEVTFDLSPNYGRGFRAPIPPVSTFKGVVIGTNSMEGRYSVKRQRGPWWAIRSAQGTNRTVSVLASTKLALLLTSNEYDLLYSLRPPLSPTDAESKERRRVAGHYEVEETVGELGGWLYHYRMLGDFVRISPATSEQERRLQEKILRFLNNHGYPWKSIAL